TLRPVSMSDAPRAAAGGGLGRTLVALALLSGLGVTLYRNDALRGAARSMGQERTYARLEQALGGPGFGTLRSVEQFSKGAADALRNTGTQSRALGATSPPKSVESASAV